MKINISELKKSGAFTIIELLVVIAVIGALLTAVAVTVSEVRDTARDTVRMGHVSQIQTALKAYYRDSGSYPSVITPGQAFKQDNTIYMEEVPNYPTPADGSCADDFEYTYTRTDSGESYDLLFCLGEPMDQLPAGTLIARPSGIIADPDCSSTCGNSSVECSEECDDGNADNTDACLNTCIAASCGDGYVWSGNEDCDDGNTIDGDGCDSNCNDEGCGNGTVDDGEECDDYDTDPTDTYHTNNATDDDGECVIETCLWNDCGDGYRDAATEECDDGNTVSGDGCSSTCVEECLTTMCQNWGYRVAISIQSGQVCANLSNFPVLLTEDNLPSAIFTYAETDGSDIRITTDESGETEIPFEIVSFDTGNSTAEIWTKVSSLSSSSNTTIYVWYDNSSASAYAATDTYGSQNVWDSNYKLVSHDGGLTDSTQYDNDCTEQNSISGGAATGKIGSGTYFNGSGNRFICPEDASLELTTTVMMELWVNRDTDSGSAESLIAMTDSGNVDYWMRIYADKIGGGTYFPERKIEGTSTASVTLDTWEHIVYGYVDARYHKTYKNGGNYVGTDEGTADTIRTLSSTYLYFGYRANMYNFNGTMDEIRLSDTERSANWYCTQFANQNDPAAFAIEGTPVIPE